MIEKIMGKLTGVDLWPLHSAASAVRAGTLTAAQAAQCYRVSQSDVETLAAEMLEVEQAFYTSDLRC